MSKPKHTLANLVGKAWADALAEARADGRIDFDDAVALARRSAHFAYKRAADAGLSQELVGMALEAVVEVVELVKARQAEGGKDEDSRATRH